MRSVILTILLNEKCYDNNNNFIETRLQDTIIGK